MPPEEYTTLKIPAELARRVDEYVKDNPWGYRTRAEFVADAIRRALRETDAGSQLDRAMKHPGE